MLFRQTTQKAISIHALLAESDDAKEEQEEKEQQISIHALLAESDLRDLCDDMYLVISIHALLAESDSVILRVMRRP